MTYQNFNFFERAPIEIVESTKIEYSVKKVAEVSNTDAELNFLDVIKNNLIMSISTIDSARLKTRAAFSKLFS